MAAMSRLAVVAFTLAALLVGGCSSKGSGDADGVRGAAASDGGESKASAVSASQMAERVRELIAAGKPDAVYAMFDEAMKGALSESDMRTFVSQLVDAKGAWLSVESDQVTADRGVFVVHAERGDWRMELAVSAEGLITGLRVREGAAAPPLAKSTIELGLPFRGTWHVFWGGDKPEDNHHLDHPSQRRAADLVMVGEDGKTHTGTGETNSDYLAYGRDILAVAPGKVITVVDGVPDNVPGEMNPYMTTGNVVIIEHAGGAHSAYAHLIPGSPGVKVGDVVKRGQVIGRCGNSGNSSETHLHFQLQDGPSFADSWGIEPVFAKVTVRRAGVESVVTDYVWKKADLVIASGKP